MRENEPSALRGGHLYPLLSNSRVADSGHRWRKGPFHGKLAAIEPLYFSSQFSPPPPLSLHFCKNPPGGNYLPLQRIIFFYDLRTDFIFIYLLRGWRGRRWKTLVNNNCWWLSIDILLLILFHKLQTTFPSVRASLPSPSALAYDYFLYYNATSLVQRESSPPSSGDRRRGNFDRMFIFFKVAVSWMAAMPPFFNRSTAEDSTADLFTAIFSTWLWGERVEVNVANGGRVWMVYRVLEGRFKPRGRSLPAARSSHETKLSLSFQPLFMNRVCSKVVPPPLPSSPVAS